MNINNIENMIYENNLSYNFFVIGTPMGKERPRMSKYGKVYTPSKTKRYEEYVVECLKEKYEEIKMFDRYKPLEVIIHAYYPLPDRYSYKNVGKKIQKGEFLPIIKPDVDNVSKIILDALNNVLYHDDSQVAKLVVGKSFPVNCGGEGVLVSVRELQNM